MIEFDPIAFPKIRFFKRLDFILQNRPLKIYVSVFLEGPRKQMVCITVQVLPFSAFKIVCFPDINFAINNIFRFINAIHIITTRCSHAAQYTNLDFTDFARFSTAHYYAARQFLFIVLPISPITFLLCSMMVRYLNCAFCAWDIFATLRSML